MKKILVLIIPALFLCSCLDDDAFPRVENITKGGKWTLKIGSTPEEVYSQLQEFAVDKVFDVAVVYRNSFSRPEEVRDLLPFYNAITLQNSAPGRIDRAVFYLDQDKVSRIEAGGGMPEEVFQWPLEVPDGVSILGGDPLDVLYAKLVTIYQMPAYSNYQIYLPNKSLDKPFDPDMANYEQWNFSFETKVRPSVNGRSSVTLYFGNGVLKKIHHEYNEATVYIDVQQMN